MASRHLLSPRDNPALLSLVIPAYNEQEVIPELRERLEKFLPTLPCPAEVIIVNDGSADATLDMLLDWAAADKRIRVVGLARNFGHQAAVTAGLDAAVGDAIAVIDCDLQDPPEVILEMLAQYRLGYEVVYGQRGIRLGETVVKRVTAWLFYWIMQKLIYRDLPRDTGDFRLVSRRCLDALSEMRETHRFLRGMVAWVGFAQTAVKYERAPRAAGEAKYSYRLLAKLAWTAAVSFSPLPLRLGLMAGLAVATVGLTFGVYVVLGRLFGWYTPPQGWASLVVLISVLGGAVLVSNGILGEYVGRIYEEAKDRPLYIVSQSANLASAEHNRGVSKT